MSYLPPSDAFDEARLRAKIRDATGAAAEQVRLEGDPVQALESLTATVEAML